MSIAPRLPGCKARPVQSTNSKYWAAVMMESYERMLVASGWIGPTLFELIRFARARTEVWMLAWGVSAMPARMGLRSTYTMLASTAGSSSDGLFEIAHEPTG